MCLLYVWWNSWENLETTKKITHTLLSKLISLFENEYMIRSTLKKWNKKEERNQVSGGFLKSWIADGFLLSDGKRMRWLFRCRLLLLKEWAETLFFLDWLFINSGMHFFIYLFIYYLLMGLGSLRLSLKTKTLPSSSVITEGAFGFAFCRWFLPY